MPKTFLKPICVSHVDPVLGFYGIFLERYWVSHKYKNRFHCDVMAYDPSFEIERKIGLPYAGGVSVSQILAHREKLALNQHSLNKDAIGTPPQSCKQMNPKVWPQSGISNTQIMSNRLQGYPDSPQNHQLVRCHDQAGNRVMAGSPVVVGDGSMMVQQSNTPSNISHPQIQQNQQIVSNNPNAVNIQSQQIIGPNGQIINVHPINANQNQTVNHIPHPNSGGVILQGQNVVQAQQQPQQHRIFINGQPEPSGPGRPNIQMIPVSISNQQGIMNQQRQDAQQRVQQVQQQPQQLHFYNSPFPPVQQYDQIKNVRPFNPAMNGFRPQNNNQIVPASLQAQHQQQKMQWHHRMQHNINQQQQQPQPSQQVQINQPGPQPVQGNIYERVPPLHQHTPSSVWQEEIKRKRSNWVKW
ncbi:hypothetical protein NQ317_002969 [Molorchus minor]|uniref:Uncharacterized protein n=1 Tax=Molorchus minor TaxID=1323400 RepID=A0ABQ9J8Z4_9CUCU|nr:hypothetical protein NQ317_002969 [Molorchus minor]